MHLPAALEPVPLEPQPALYLVPVASAAELYLLAMACRPTGPAVEYALLGRTAQATAFAPGEPLLSVLQHLFFVSFRSRVP